MKLGFFVFSYLCFINQIKTDLNLRQTRINGGYGWNSHHSSDFVSFHALNLLQNHECIRPL